MPELPEVETVKNTLLRLVKNKKIKEVEVLRAKNIDGDADEFQRLLKDRTILDLSRVGKFIIFHFDHDIVMISHLRMEGKYYLKNEGEVIGKHDLVIFHFVDGTYLAYNDTRRFGVIKLSTEKCYLTEEPLKSVGPDPFLMKDSSRLSECFKNKHIPIKQALLDQSIMSGLGNIYVDEVLFLSKIHPETPAKLLNKAQLDQILSNSRAVLSKAIKAGGSTIKSYHPQQGISGEFQVQLQVYGHGGGVCPNCGHRLRKTVVGGRGTTYCPHCQKNFALPHVIALSGPIASGKSEVANYLKEKGYKVLDADEVVHELYKDEHIQKELQKIIPNLVVSNGEVDREFLKNYLLDNPNKKSRLEKFIFAQVDEKIHHFIYQAKKDDRLIIEVPLLFQAHLDDYADEIYLLQVSPKVEKERLLKRGQDYDSYLKLNKSYFAQEEKKKATAIIDNDEDVASLKKKIDSLICGK